MTFCHNDPFNPSRVATPKRCKVCELDASERIAAEAALPAALAAKDDGDALRELASRHAVTMAALRRHSEEGHAAPVTAPAAAQAPVIAAVVPAVAPAPAPKVDAALAETAAGDGWADTTIPEEPTKPAPEGAQPWLRPRAARAEIEAQVKRLGELLKDTELTLAERLKVEPLLRQALAQLALVSGETKPSDMDRILVSPEFARVMGAIGRVLMKRCPAVYPEIVATVRALDTEAGESSGDAPARAA